MITALSHGIFSIVFGFSSQLYTTYCSMWNPAEKNYWLTMTDWWLYKFNKCWKTALKLRLHTHFYIENAMKLICISAFWQVTIKSFNIWSIRHMTSLSPVTSVMWNLEVCAISAFRNDSWVVDGFNRKPRKKKKKSWLWLSYINYVKLWRSNQSRLIGHVLYACIVTQPWCLKAADIGFD